MAELVRQYFYLALLMRRPQDVSANELTLPFGLALSLVTYVITLAALIGIGPAVLRAVADLTLTGAALYVALYLTGKSARFAQSFGGYCGAVAIVNLAALPLYVGQGSRAAESVGLGDFVLLVWNLSLIGHVIRHTFEVRLPIGILYAFGYVLVITSLLASLLPPAGA